MRTTPLAYLQAVGLEETGKPCFGDQAMRRIRDKFILLIDIYLSSS